MEQKLTLYIPDTFEDAKKIVPNITEEQFEKWKREGAVELRVQKVYRISQDLAYVGFNKNSVPNITEVKSYPVVVCSCQYFTLYAVLAPFCRPSLVQKFANSEVDKKCLKIIDICRDYLDLDIPYPDDVAPIAKAFLAEKFYDLMEMLEKDDTAYIDYAHTVVKCTVLDRFWILEPKNLYLLETEPINVPRDMLPIDTKFRSTFHRLGWCGVVANIDPGFSGRLRVLLFTAGQHPMTLILFRNARLVQVRFLKLDKALEGYSGQYQETS